MPRVLRFVLAFAIAMATPIAVMAQTAGQGSGQAAPSATRGSTADQRIRMALRMKAVSPTMPIGVVSAQAMLSPVDDAELDQLRGDLISLSAILGNISPAVGSRLATGSFDEDHLQAMTDEQLTLLYNTLPDPVTFHVAIASLRHADRQATARKLAARAAQAAHSGDADEHAAGADHAARPDGLELGDALDGTPLSQSISDPVFYTGGCPGTYYDGPTIAGFHAVLNTLNIAVLVAKAVLDAATVEIFGARNTAPFVAVWGALRVAAAAVYFGLNLVEFCDGSVRDSYTDTTYDNLRAILANLDEHDRLEKAFLKEFRTFYVRKEVEKNLLLTGDQRISLFQLPAQVMVQPEGVSITVTQQIVLDTIQRNQLAGMPIGNAQTLYNDGSNLLSQNKYKDAYARFRSAYQAAVNGTVR